MKKVQLLLSYYTLIISTSLIIWGLFVAQKPQGLIVVLAFLPIGLYFWLQILGVFKTSHLNNSNFTFQPVIFIALLVSSVSSLAYAAFTNQILNSPSEVQTIMPPEFKSSIKQLTKQNEEQSQIMTTEVTQELKKITSHLANIESKQTNSQSQQIKSVTLKDQNTSTANVYESKSVSSKVVTEAKFGGIYPYIEKDANWYFVLIGGKNGYIESRIVKETIF